MFKSCIERITVFIGFLYRHLYIIALSIEPPAMLRKIHFDAAFLVEH